MDAHRRYIGRRSNVHLFADGLEVSYGVNGTDATESRSDDSPTPVTINCSGGNGYSGAIDDVRLFGDVLSAAEIAAIYNERGQRP